MGRLERHALSRAVNAVSSESPNRSRLMRWLQSIPSKDPLERAHAPAIQLMLIMLCVGIGIFQLLSLFSSFSAQPGSALNWLVVTIGLVALWLIRSGSLQAGVRLLLTTLVVIMVVAYSQVGLLVQLPNLLSQAAILVLGALVLSRSMFWLGVFGFVLAFAVGAWVDHLHARFAFRPFIGATLSLVIVALLLDSLGQNLRRLLYLSLSRENDLQRSELKLKQEVVAREQAQAMLLTVQKQEALGTLSLAITHDFNHGLSAICQEAESALAVNAPENADSAPESGAQAHARWQTVQLQALHLARILQGLMQVVRDNRGDVQVFDAIAALRVLEPLLHHVAGKRARLVVSLHAEQALIRMDHGLFDMLMVNLIGNAHDAVTAQGQITITAQTSGDYLHLSVHDDGMGMDVTTQQRAIEPFFTTKAKGNGLGLPITKRVVEDAKGVFSIQSSPGHGCEVRVSLPLVAELLKSAPLVHEGSVLVVEDDPDMAQISEVFLRAAGYQVAHAENGLAMLEQLRKQQFTAVLVDERMPVMAGSAAIKIAFSEGRLPPTVHVSADEMPEHLRAEFAAARVVHLPKPFTREGLLQALLRARG